MHARFRLFRSVGFSALEAAAHAMRLSRMLAFAGLLSVATCAACSQAPTAPQEVITVRNAGPFTVTNNHGERVVTNIPFTYEGHETDTPDRLCATQPRSYVDSEGPTYETDYYAVKAPRLCPATLIN